MCQISIAREDRCKPRCWNLFDFYGTTQTFNYQANIQLLDWVDVISKCTYSLNYFPSPSQNAYIVRYHESMTQRIPIGQSLIIMRIRNQINQANTS